ncbi:MAG: alpha-glucosidase C-terminal domain-containing protein [Chloroflexota bacterium]|nr:alpha-glucosidase C-terminal domain-containing protein [Chloroflexota bacterium]
MLRLRRATPALIAGDYHALHQHSEAYLAFLRHDAETQQSCLVVLNFSNEEQTIIFDLSDKQPRLLFSSEARDDEPLSLDWLTLVPFEIFIAELA